MKAETRDRLSGMTVLVVDDVAEIRGLIRQILELEGATVVEAGTGRKALEFARTQAFDVVLTDLGLPDMSGEMVIAGIRSASQAPPPVAVVSGADAKALARALDVGAERVFAKPIDRGDLMRYLAGKRTVAAIRNVPAGNP